MGTWESNGHVVKVVTPIHLEANISKNAGDRGIVTKSLSIEWSRDIGHMTI